MSLSAQAWEGHRATLLAAKGRAAAVSQNVADLITGFKRQAFEKRCTAGHCVHDGYFHITQGWNPGSGTFVSSHFRTKDFIVAEKAMGTGMVPTIFNEAASFGGLVWRGPGFDVLPPVSGNDLTTDAVYWSDTGSDWVLESGYPSVPRECAAMLSHDGYLYQFLGVRYTGHSSPTYFMPQDAWRKSSGAWEQRASNLPKRRSFAYESWNGSIFVIGGADDHFNGQNYRKVYGDILKSDDGMQTLTSVGEGPFGPGYGRRSAQFQGHVVLVGGAAGDGGFSDPVTFTNKVWASNHPSLIPSSWFELAPLPVSLNHAMVGTLVVDGVETLAVIGGYNNVTHSGGGPLGTIYTLDSLEGEWQARTDSDFWV